MCESAGAARHTPGGGVHGEAAGRSHDLRSRPNRGPSSATGGDRHRFTATTGEVRKSADFYPKIPEYPGVSLYQRELSGIFMRDACRRYTWDRQLRIVEGTTGGKTERGSCQDKPTRHNRPANRPGPPINATRRRRQDRAAKKPASAAD